MLQTLYPDGIGISAKTGFGLDALSKMVTLKYKGTELLVQVTTNPANGKVQSFLRAHGRILNEQFYENFVLIEAILGQNQLPDLQRLMPEHIEIIED